MLSPFIHVDHIEDVSYIKHNTPIAHNDRVHHVTNIAYIKQTLVLRMLHIYNVLIRTMLILMRIANKSNLYNAKQRIMIREIW